MYCWLRDWHSPVTRNVLESLFWSYFLASGSMYCWLRDWHSPVTTTEQGADPRPPWRWMLWPGCQEKIWWTSWILSKTRFLIESSPQTNGIMSSDLKIGFCAFTPSVWFGSPVFTDWLFGWFDQCVKRYWLIDTVSYSLGASEFYTLC